MESLGYTTCMCSIQNYFRQNRIKWCHLYGISPKFSQWLSGVRCATGNPLQAGKRGLLGSWKWYKTEWWLHKSVQLKKNHQVVHWQWMDFAVHLNDNYTLMNLWRKGRRWEKEKRYRSLWMPTAAWCPKALLSSGFGVWRPAGEEPTLWMKGVHGLAVSLTRDAVS